MFARTVEPRARQLGSEGKADGRAHTENIRAARREPHDNHNAAGGDRKTSAGGGQRGHPRGDGIGAQEGRPHCTNRADTTVSKGRGCH
eukprot:14017972-Heterocapsa_arctica.AAC.1